jgi:transcription-repair coupling factor (superfamily II helicase)
MSLLADLAQLLETAPGFARCGSMVSAGDDCSLATGSAVRPLVVASLFRAAPRATLVVVPGVEGADRFARQLTAYLPLERVLTLPVPEALPWERRTVRKATAARRARAVFSLAEGRPVVVVAPARSLLRRLAPRSAPEVYRPLALAAGAEIDLTEASEELARMGYERLDDAKDPGTFSVRGGTLDVFPADGHYPVRAELVGDDIETLRKYVPGTGQTVGDAPDTEVFPCRELRLSRSVSKDIEHAYRSAFRDLKEKALGDPELAHELDLIAQGVYFDGVDAYLPRIYKELAATTDYVARDALVVVAEPSAIFGDLTRGSDEIVEAAAAAHVDAARHFLEPGEVDLGGRQRLTLLSLLRAGGAADAEISTRRPDVAGGESRTVAGLRGLLETGNRVVMTAHDRRQGETLARSLSEAGLPVVTYAGSVQGTLSGDDAPGGLGERVVHLAVADVRASSCPTRAWLSSASTTRSRVRRVAARSRT